MVPGRARTPVLKTNFRPPCTVLRMGYSAMSCLRARSWRSALSRCSQSHVNKSTGPSTMFLQLLYSPRLTCRDFHPDSVPGSNGITTHMVQFLVQEVFSVLVYLFISCPLLSCFPPHRKQGLVTFIWIPVRPPAGPSSH